MFDSMKPLRTLPVNRRHFLQATAVAGFGSLLKGEFDSLSADVSSSAAVLNPTGSDVGSLFPFIQSQAVKGEFPLSFLNSRFRSLRNWKKIARSKLLDLLHYAPPSCDPAAEMIERVD